MAFYGTASHLLFLIHAAVLPLIFIFSSSWWRSEETLSPAALSQRSPCSWSGDSSGATRRVSIWKFPEHFLLLRCAQRELEPSRQPQEREMRILLNQKKSQTLRLWNVRTLLVPRSRNLLVEILRARLINIACLHETRIPDEGHTILSAHNPEA